jgi:F-type H+-transporting ATPase subunit delta
MTGSRAAIRYAKAMLGLAKDQNATDAVDADMKQVVQTIAASKDLQSMLQSPIIKTEIKKASLKEIFKSGHAITQGMIDVLADNKRINLLQDVAQKYIVLFDELKGKEVAVVTTAVPLTAELEKKVLAKVKELTGNDVTLENKVDDSIVGGFILRVGDLQYNASIANQLNKLKREISLN